MVGLGFASESFKFLEVQYTFFNPEGDFSSKSVLSIATIMTTPWFESVLGLKN